MPPPPTSPNPALAAWRLVERPFDAAFGSARNPLRHLGALGFLCFWLLAVSGIYLYAVLDTSVDGAYPSIEQLSLQPWYVGGWLRSLHRYAADAFVIVMLLHLLREWVHGRFRHFRRFSWLTGVPLIAFVFTSAIGGFWLNWDQLGQFSAQATAEWLDALPGLATPLARNFLSAEAVSDRLFSLFVFVHLGVPLLLVFGLWFHIQRITRAAVFPPRALALGTAAVLIGLALAWPVTQHPPADLSQVPAALALDWVLLFLHPLTYATSPGVVWFGVAGSFVLLLALPFLPSLPSLPPLPSHPSLPARGRMPVALVDADNCNGCRRCFADCPYAAITMVPHPNQKVGKELAQVNADLCASCGICAGACPSSTPFRSGTALVTGIDMPQLTVQQLREQLRAGLAACEAARPIVVFGCDHGGPRRGTGRAGRAAAQPDLRRHAAAVLRRLRPARRCRRRCWSAAVPRVAASSGSASAGPPSACSDSASRSLRRSVPEARLAVAWAAAGDESALQSALRRTAPDACRRCR